jgi:two-component system, OmpR family, sensor histidine kinase CiaH
MKNNMFKQLRNKFLILNMSIISLIMITAFVIVYFTTNHNIQLENERKLREVPSTSSFTENSAEENEKIMNSLVNGKEEKGLTVRQTISSNYFMSFSLEVDHNGKILHVDSIIELPEETYVKAAELAWNSGKGLDTIKLENKLWQYSITQPETSIISSDGKQTTVTKEEDRFLISFIDITDTQKTLNNLLFTFIIVGIIMLAVIFFISLGFANKAIKPISKAWEKQKQFVADASHELKTPLSIINANYDVLRSNKEETIESQMKWLEYIRVGSDRMTKLVNDLLILAKTEDTVVEVLKIPFDAGSVIHEVLQSMSAEADKKEVELSYDIQPNLIINSDKELVRQLVMILYDNAIKYTNDYGKIEVSLIKEKRYIIFRVKNSGKGIAKADLTRIFDRFYRTDPSRTGDSGGFGLGLSIAKNIISKLGGEISADSIENEWVVVTFKIPM